MLNFFSKTLLKKPIKEEDIMFSKIKKYYDKGYYTERHIAVFVQKDVLTPNEYKEITGQDYPVV